MSASIDRPTPWASAQESAARWEQVGRDLAPSLDGAAAVVVIGADAEAAASVALGVGRAQCRRRRVAIGDLVGEVAPLQSLVTGDDPHGVVDSFLYGVSLNRIARPADGSGNLFILPSGSEPIVAEEILRSTRWARLAIGFREVGALLLLVAPATAAGVDGLALQLDGVLLVGEDTPAPAGAPVLAVATLPTPVATVEVGASEHAPAMAPGLSIEDGEGEIPPEDPALPEPPLPVAAGYEPATGDTVRAARWVRRVADAPRTQVNLPTIGPGAPGARPTPAADTALEAEEGVVGREGDWRQRLPRRPRWLVPAAAGLVALLGAGALLSRGGGTRSEAGRRATGPGRDSLPAAAVATPAATSAAPVETPAAAAAAGGAAVPTVTAASGAVMRLVNPGDSAQAARYSVQLVAANTREGALAKRRQAGWLPAATISPMTLAPEETRWYRLTVGAYTDRPSADAYMATLRARGKLAADAGTVVEVPFAVLLEPSVPVASAPKRVSGYLARGLPAYGLLQEDGTMRIFAGAFETMNQAALLADRLEAAGMAPAVAYRTGRPF